MCAIDEKKKKKKIVPVPVIVVFTALGTTEVFWFLPLEVAHPALEGNIQVHGNGQTDFLQFWALSSFVVFIEIGQ